MGNPAVPRLKNKKISVPFKSKMRGADVFIWKGIEFECKILYNIKYLIVCSLREDSVIPSIYVSIRRTVISFCLDDEKA